jgi:hypothetical protein
VPSAASFEEIAKDAKLNSPLWIEHREAITRMRDHHFAQILERPLWTLNKHVALPSIAGDHCWFTDTGVHRARVLVISTNTTVPQPMAGLQPHLLP